MPNGTIWAVADSIISDPSKGEVLDHRETQTFVAVNPVCMCKDSRDRNRNPELRRNGKF
jgi:hypothetical protein